MKRDCPICHQPTDSEKDSNFPFCSDRCRLQDLGNWASEKYRVSSPAFDESELEGIEREATQADSTINLDKKQRDGQP